MQYECLQEEILKCGSADGLHYFDNVRNNREKITFTLHPDIVGVIRSIATEEDIPMSVVADEAMYAGLKKLGRLD